MERGSESFFTLGTIYTHKSFWEGAGPVAHRLPLEHIASPSCQNVHGINGHKLSVAEMKNCRTHRFVIPKPDYWKSEEIDGIFGSDSYFILSGESNGS